MPENSPKNSLLWTEEHDEYCYKHHLTPAAKSLLQWLIRQGETASEIEPDLAEFNAWVEKNRGKAYSHNYLKQTFQSLVDNRIVQVVKQYSWKVFKLLVRPLDWLKPPRKKREKNLQVNNSSYNLHPSNNDSAVPGYMQQQHSNSEQNQTLLAENGIYFDSEETEVLNHPSNEIKLALLIFNLRGGFEKSFNPEGFIRRCLRKRWWEQPRNYNVLLQMFGNSTEWDELFPSG